MDTRTDIDIRVKEITPQGLIAGDGVEHKADVIVCATGYNIDYVPPFQVRADNGL